METSEDDRNDKQVNRGLENHMPATETEEVRDKFSEMLETIYKHKEVLAELESPADNSGSGTEHILKMISGQCKSTSLAI